MVSIAPDAAIAVLHEGSTASATQRLAAMRTIRNAVIGSSAKKTAYLRLGVLKVLTPYLSDTSDVEVSTLAAVVVASLALRRIDASDVEDITPRLLTLLTHKDYRLVEAASRALKSVLSLSLVTKFADNYSSNNLPVIVRLMNPQVSTEQQTGTATYIPPSTIPQHWIRISEVATIILGRMSLSQADLSKCRELGAFQILTDHLEPQWNFSTRLQKASISALSSLCTDDSSLLIHLSTIKGSVTGRSLVELALDLVYARDATTRLNACEFLVSLHKCRMSYFPSSMDDWIVPVVFPCLISLMEYGIDHITRVRYNSPLGADFDPKSNSMDIVRSSTPDEAAMLRSYSSSSNANQDNYSVEASSQYILETVPVIFTDLISSNENLKQAAMDGNAIQKLVNILKESTRDVTDENSTSNNAPFTGFTGIAKDPARKDLPAASTFDFGPEGFVQPVMTQTGSTLGSDNQCSHKISDKALEETLTALATFSATSDDCRKCVIESKVLPSIVKLLEHKSAVVRTCACDCVKSLSRSVKNLRTALVDVGISKPLLKLLDDESVDVKNSACATICNMVLDFSPMKVEFLDNGGVKKLVKLMGSDNESIRVNVIWALKNLLYQADSQVKVRVMKYLGWHALRKLTKDENDEIREQAMNLLRNLACGKNADISLVYNKFGAENLGNCIEVGLCDENTDIVYQTLYVAANLATGGAVKKDLIIGRPKIVDAIMKALDSKEARLRLAAVRIIDNIVCAGYGAAERVETIRKLGFESKLELLVDDPSIDVRDRVAATLTNLQPHDDQCSFDSMLED